MWGNMDKIINSGHFDGGPDEHEPEPDGGDLITAGI